MGTTRNKRVAAIAVAALLPSIVTWAYFHLLAESPSIVQQSTYAVGKLLQFGFPIFWVAMIAKELGRTGIQAVPPIQTATVWTTRKNILLGCVLGLLICLAMMGVYWFVLDDSVRSGLQAQVADRIRGLSLASWQSYLGLSLFYALVHSLLEEYYYRWFIYGQLRQVSRMPVAALVSGLAFMAHHVIVLAQYFGNTLLTAFLSLSIMVGGVIWAWQYERSRSLLGPWLSHAVVDAGIFAIGYFALRAAGVME